MGLTSAVHWWEDWQMRILVLGSLLVQFLLLIFSYLRRITIPRWFRFIMWLAYLTGDAVAIYALATLFNRHKDNQQDRGGSSISLEVVWAPVLLIHLGGHDGISAYNIEDNELWSRHLLTAVSQITVAIYVFYKSWPGSDKRLLQAAIMLFVVGVLKCFAKPLALRRASINRLVSSSILTGKQTATVRRQNQGSNKICPLEEYVEEAKNFVAQRRPKTKSMQAQGDVNPTQVWWQKIWADPLHAQWTSELYKSMVNRLKANVRNIRVALSVMWEPEVDLLKEWVTRIRNHALDGEPSVENESMMDLLKAYVKRKRDTQHERFKKEVGLLDEYVMNNGARAGAYEQNDEEGATGARSPAEDGNHHLLAQQDHERQQRQREVIMRCEAYKLFVDLLSPYPHRLSFLKYFWVLSEEEAEKSYDSLRQGLAGAFLLLYTRLGFAAKLVGSDSAEDNWTAWTEYVCAACVKGACLVLPWAAIALFQWSHREAYTDIDVKITYVLFCCTAVLEAYSGLVLTLSSDNNAHPPPLGTLTRRGQWPEMVAQYSLVGYVARKQEHSWMMPIADLFGCKGMRPCFSSHRITRLVLQYLKDGWENQIQDAATYRSFNDNRGHWTLKVKGYERQLGWSIERPFDESVLLWHIATDLCFFLSQFPDHRCAFADNTVLLAWLLGFPKQRDTTRAHQGTSSTCCQESTVCKAVQCRQMSNYMMYLMVINPEMLLPGTRRNLFTTTNSELQEICKTSLFKTTYKEIKNKELKDNNHNVYKRVTRTIKEVNNILRDRNWNPIIYKQLRPEKGERLMGRAISTTMRKKSKKASEDESRKGSEESMEGGKEESTVGSEKKFIDDAWTIAQVLLDMSRLSEEEMWKVIEGVWVEMLCFSASRCRGYLHAKALGSGGEFLSYIWLLQFYMGAETFTERLQREEFPIPSREELIPSTKRERLVVLRSWEGNNKVAAPSTSNAHAASSTSSTSVFPSTSEIHFADEDMV